MNQRTSHRRRAAALTLALAVGLSLAACSTQGGQGAGRDGQSQDSRPALEMDGPEQINDSDNSGLEVVERLFESADVLVVSADDPRAERIAAEEALKRNAPMVTQVGRAEDLGPIVKKLGIGTIVTAGEVVGLEELNVDVEQLTLPDDEVEPTREDVVAEIASMPTTNDDHPVRVPPVFVTAKTSPAAIATAKAAGAEVHMLEHADPRESSESMKVATGGDTLAIGEEFGGTERFAAAVDLAHNGELPGGGGLVFPGRRMIATYGHPSGPALGVMGERPAPESVDYVRDLVSQYEPFSDQPVIPAFEIIVSVASQYPGEDGNYTNEFPVEDYVEYIDAITEAGGYVVIDLQPGRASFIEQAKLYEELLLRPNVGLALDPEWKIGPNELPMQRIGSAEAAEINEVADWLAALVRENDLPQKAFVVHQFQLQMLRDRDQINTDHPELAFVLHADGHGTPDLKFETWNVLREGLSDKWFMAWKNFIDEDTPTFTPQQTYEEVEPRPWFVSYQ